MSGAWLAAFLALWFVVVLLGLLVLGLLRRIGPVLERAETIASSAAGPGIGLPPGTTVPPFELRLSHGGMLTAADLRGTPYVVLFVSSGCAPCRRLAAEIREAESPAPAVELIVVIDESDYMTDHWEFPNVTLAYQANGDVSRAFGTSATPHAFAVDPVGSVVTSSFPNTLDQLQALANDAGKGGDLATTDTMGSIPA